MKKKDNVVSISKKSDELGQIISDVIVAAREMDAAIKKLSKKEMADVLHLWGSAISMACVRDPFFHAFQKKWLGDIMKNGHWEIIECHLKDYLEDGGE